MIAEIYDLYYRPIMHAIFGEGGRSGIFGKVVAH
jgi:hypothetical protein